MICFFEIIESVYDNKPGSHMFDFNSGMDARAHQTCEYLLNYSYVRLFDYLHNVILK